MNDSPASDETKSALENSVAWLLSDQLGEVGTVIVTKKYMTTDNTLVYLTQCKTIEAQSPRVMVRVLNRVPGGVRELGYTLYGDRRLMLRVNEMIFGKNPTQASDSASVEVSQTEAAKLVDQVNALVNARQIL